MIVRRSTRGDYCVDANPRYLKPETFGFGEFRPFAWIPTTAMYRGRTHAIPIDVRFRVQNGHQITDSRCALAGLLSGALTQFHLWCPKKFVDRGAEPSMSLIAVCAFMPELIDLDAR